MEAIDFSWFLNADRLTAIFRGRLHPAIGFTRTCSHGHEDADVRRLWRKDASALQRNTTPSGKMRSEENTSELQSLMRLSYAVFCLTNKTQIQRLLSNKKTIKTKLTRHLFH